MVESQVAAATRAIICQTEHENDKSTTDRKGRVVYISGPMSGCKDNNAAAFDERKEKLAALGFSVVSPVDLDRRDVDFLGSEPAYGDCLRRDIAAMLECDLINYLPGAERSTGAMLERDVANVIGLKEINEHGEMVTRKNVLQIADNLTGGDRQNAYGHPAEDFARTAKFWSALFGFTVTPEQVGLAMVLLKVSREVNRHKDDNLIDCAGYVRTVEMVYEWKKNQAAKSALGNSTS